MRFGLLGAALGLGMLFHGGNRLQESLTYTRMDTYSLAEFLQNPKKEGWVRITDVYFAVPDMLWIENMSEKEAEAERAGGAEAEGWVSDVYVPAATQPTRLLKQPATLLIERDDPELDELAAAVERNEPQAEMRLAFWQDPDAHVVEGMLKPVSDLGVGELPETVSKDAVVLEEAQTPRHWAIPLAIVLGGLTIFGSIAYSLFLARRLS